jgi:hypothetical protein
MKRGGHGGRGARVFYFGKKGGWKAIEKEADVNIQERYNNVHFDDRLKSSGCGDDLLAFCVESIFDARVFQLRGNTRGKFNYVSQRLGQPLKIWHAP